MKGTVLLYLESQSDVTPSRQHRHRVLLRLPPTGGILPQPSPQLGLMFGVTMDSVSVLEGEQNFRFLDNMKDFFVPDVPECFVWKVPEYLNHVSKRLEEEGDRVITYLDHSTQ